MSHSPVLNLLRGRSIDRSQESDMSGQRAAEPVRKMRLSEMARSIFEEMDSRIAIAEGAREKAELAVESMSDDNANLQTEVRFLTRLNEEQADRIDVLDRERAVAIAEATMLKARMKMFGEAAARIIEEVQRDAAAGYAPPPRPAHTPSQHQQTRPVRELGEDATEASRKLAELPEYR